MRLFALAITIAALAGCATSYRPPNMPPPPEWTGEAGLEPAPGAIPEVHNGELQENGVIATLLVDHVRTGRIVNELRYRSAYGGEMVIAAGTPARAEQLTMFVSSTYAPTPVAVGGANNPIEWCTVQVNGESVCIFWEAEGRARYIANYSTSAPRLLVPYQASGMVGPMPEIAEEDIDIGPPLTQRLVIREWNARRVQLAVQVLEDGVVGRSNRLDAQWGVTLASPQMGVAFRLDPVGPADRPTAVRVTASPLRR